LDDWGTPDDNIDLNTSIARHGLCPKLDGNATHFLSGVGTQIVPPKRVGDVVQVVNYQTGAVQTGATVIPNDDTIPQITEGNEYMTLAITPTVATNVLLIDVVAVLANTAAQYFVTALFKDAGVDALAAVATLVTTVDTPIVMYFRHQMIAGGVGATTFRVRCGGSGAGTTTLNGWGGARKYGGVLASSITITEIQA
jgi:hypothetical protein